ncbi:hypothetical protein F5Y15DRAFT_419762 [Xylariaceae sp. FL0016]|nr:hypothetical protein F5Y15DRAFT_419762 [Xylariaceae sp. FL0016]
MAQSPPTPIAQAGIASMHVNYSCSGQSFYSTLLDYANSSNAVGLSTYRGSSNSTPETNAVWRGMEGCCASNDTVHKIDNDCALWCELPASDQPGGSVFLECLTHLHANNSGWGTYRNATWDVDGDGIPNHKDSDYESRARGRHANMLGVGILAMMVGYFGMLG